jgi:hypothetical protein
VTGAQLDLLPDLDPADVPALAGVQLLFGELERIDADRAAVMLDTAQGRLDDLVALASSDRHVDDERFRSGLAWGIAALGLVIKAARGVSDPAALRLSALHAA